MGEQHRESGATRSTPGKHHSASGVLRDASRRRCGGQHSGSCTRERHRRVRLQRALAVSNHSASGAQRDARGARAHGGGTVANARASAWESSNGRARLQWALAACSHSASGAWREACGASPHRDGTWPTLGQLLKRATRGLWAGENGGGNGGRDSGGDGGERRWERRWDGGGTGGEDGGGRRRRGTAVGTVVETAARTPVGTAVGPYSHGTVANARAAAQGGSLREGEATESARRKQLLGERGGEGRARCTPSRRWLGGQSSGS